MFEFIVFCVIMITPIIVLIAYIAYKIRSKAKKKAFIETNPDVAKMSKDLPKDGILDYEKIVDESGKEIKAIQDKERVYLLPGKYTFVMRYKEYKLNALGSKTSDYGTTNIILTFAPNKEYVIKVDNDTKAYSFSEK